MSAHPQFAELSQYSFAQRSLNAFLDALRPLKSVFDDPSINEIMINGPDDVFIRQRGPDRALGIKLSDGQIRTAIKLLASMADKVVGEEAKVLSARLPGFRVEAALPPVSAKGPAMCIRRHATRIMTLDDYIQTGTITDEQARFVEETIRSRRNFLIAGGTFSGKTTLMNCMLSLVPDDQRLFVIEQVQELKIRAPNHVLIECDPEQGVDARRAVMMGMRFSPDRVILGELRGKEAFDWLDASNTGHPGSGATIHADGAPDALKRLEGLVLMAGLNLPHNVIQSRIASTVKTVFFIEHKNGERRLSQICHIEGFDTQRGEYILKTITQTGAQK